MHYLIYTCSNVEYQYHLIDAHISRYSMTSRKNKGKSYMCMIYYNPKFPLELSIDDLIPTHCSSELSRRYFISTRVFYRPLETSHHMS